MHTRRALSIILIAVASLIGAAGCGPGSPFGRQYEYEEDVYLDLDGSATVMVNASMAALDALHSLNLPIEESARIDRNAVRAAFDSPFARVTRVSRPWRRRGRRFIQVRLDVPDIRQLSKSPIFTWGEYQLTTHDSTRTTFHEVVRGEKRQAPADAGWNGSELVGFKLHLPSRIFFHNVRDLTTGGPGEVERGNILRWEQRLSDRLTGAPLDMEVRMDSQSILYRTIALFAGAFITAMLMMAGIIWWTIRREKKKRAQAQPSL
jgi:hypothetical protein